MPKFPCSSCGAPFVKQRPPYGGLSPGPIQPVLGIAIHGLDRLVEADLLLLGGIDHPVLEFCNKTDYILM